MVDENTNAGLAILKQHLHSVYLAKMRAGVLEHIVRACVNARWHFEMAEAELSLWRVWRPQSLTPDLWGRQSS